MISLTWHSSTLFSPLNLIDTLHCMYPNSFHPYLAYPALTRPAYAHGRAAPVACVHGWATKRILTRCVLFAIAPLWLSTKSQGHLVGTVICPTEARPVLACAHFLKQSQSWVGKPPLVLVKDGPDTGGVRGHWEIQRAI